MLIHVAVQNVCTLLCFAQTVLQRTTSPGVNFGDRSDEWPVTVLALGTGLMSGQSRC
jgi:hypothetical protein